MGVRGCPRKLLQWEQTIPVPGLTTEPVPPPADGGMAVGRDVVDVVRVSPGSHLASHTHGLAAALPVLLSLLVLAPSFPSWVSHCGSYAVYRRRFCFLFFCNTSSTWFKFNFLLSNQQFLAVPSLPFSCFKCLFLILHMFDKDSTYTIPL